MIPRTEMVLRTAVIGSRLQPSISAPCAFHTAGRDAHRAQESTTEPTRRRTIIKTISPPCTAKHATRYSSTTAATAASSSPVPSDAKLDWNTFFQLRKSRRRFQLGSSIGTSLASMVGGAQAVAVSDMDAIVGQIPLEPFITLGLMTFGFGGVGWLLGPIVGTAIFNMMNRKYIEQMAMKEKEFYRRIKRYRVDPSASSMANPVPDYYGERISSVKGYRQWLKDQRAFNKKRQTFV